MIMPFIHPCLIFNTVRCVIIQALIMVITSSIGDSGIRVDGVPPGSDVGAMDLAGDVCASSAAMLARSDALKTCESGWVA
jgi:hypothetical protein